VHEKSIKAKHVARYIAKWTHFLSLDNTWFFYFERRSAVQRFIPSDSLANGFFNRLFLSFVFFSLPSSSHYTVIPNAAPYSATPFLITLSHLDLYACAFRTFPMHRIATHRNATQRNSQLAAEPTPEEPRDEECTWKPATLLQSHSSPELPVSPDESFTSSCSLRNANDRQLSANPCSLPDPSFATVSDLPKRTVIGYRCRGRKYERSRSEVTLLSSVELCGEFRGNDITRTDWEIVAHQGDARIQFWYQCQWEFC